MRLQPMLYKQKLFIIPVCLSLSRSQPEGKSYQIMSSYWNCPIVFLMWVITFLLKKLIFSDQQMVHLQTFPISMKETIFLYLNWMSFFLLNIKIKCYCLFLKYFVTTLTDFFYFCLFSKVKNLQYWQRQITKRHDYIYPYGVSLN